MPSEIVTIATKDLFVPDWNPRKLIKEGPLQDLVGYLKAGKIVPRLWVWNGNGQAPFAVISGQRRLLAYRRLGVTQLEVEVFVIPLEEAKDLAISSNQDDEMHWWDRYKSVAERAKTYSGSQRSLAPILGVDPATVNRSIRIFGALTPAAVALLDEQFITENPEYELPFRVVLALTDLKDPEKVEKTLKVAINLKLTEGHAKSLVKSVQAGNPPETYTGHKAPKAPKPKPAPAITPEALAKAVELAEQLGVAKGRGEDPKPAQELLDAHLAGIKTAPTTVPEPSHPITSTEGFSLLRQKVRDIAKEVFKPSPKTEATAEKEVHANGNINGPLAQPNHVSRPVVSTQAKPLKWFEKLAHGFVKHVWHKFLKYEHRFCKEIAKLAVPEHYTHSGQTRSGHGGNRGLTKSLTTFALTFLHWAVYGLIQFAFGWVVTMGLVSRFAPGLRPWFEWPFRFAARQVLGLPAWAWAWAQIPGNLVPALVMLAIVLWLIYLARKAEPARVFFLGVLIFAGWYYGRKWSEVPLVPETQPTEAVATPAPQTTPIIDVVKKIVSVSKPIEKPNPIPAPAVVYQPAVSFTTTASTLNPSATLYDPKILESEIKSLPQNAIVKDFPLTPDEGMPGDLAVSRLQDLTDTDKYTMKIGGGTQKILSLNATTTNLILNYKSADAIGGFLDGSGQLNFFWEDVKYIHTNEIDVETKNPVVFYQCSLVVEGSKNPLTIQCAAAEDLEHLVSTLQYFIRTSRLGHDTALGGMPYTLQGLRFTDMDNMINLLWANSPADKAGLQIGDHLWSVGKNTLDRQEKKDLEKGLSSLPYANGNNNGPSLADSHSESAPSNHGSQLVASTQMQPNLAPRLVGSAQVTLYAVSDSDWNKANTAKNLGMTTTFRPKLRKVVLGTL